jgi:hypothetical protein
MGLDLGWYRPGEIKNTFTASCATYEIYAPIRSVVRKKIGGAAILEWGVSNFLLDTAL